MAATGAELMPAGHAALQQATTGKEEFLAREAAEMQKEDVPARLLEIFTLYW